jgi:ubiquinol-cytochrome c reductase core subunit 2
MKSAARPFLAAFRREYSAQAAAASKPRINLAKQSPKVSKLPNGLVIASYENNAPITRIAVVYNAGSRYEGPGTEGVTHCLRSLSDLSTAKATNFSIVRNIQQVGGTLECTSSREHLIYSVESTRNSVEVAAEYLAAASGGPLFLDWELEDNFPRVKSEALRLSGNPDVLAMEVLHKAAYRNGLGNSLYVNPNKVSHLNSNVLKNYVSSHFVPANMAVVGVGIDHDLLQHYVNVKLGLNKLPSGTAVVPEKATYHGGEVRIDTSSNIVHAAVVTEGVSLGSKDMLSLAVLQKALGTGPSIKYSSGSSKISQAGAQAVSGPFAASTININYSDSGIFGFYTISQATDSGKLLKSLVQLFSNATKGVSDADVQRGKNQLKASLLMDLENGVQELQDMASQAILSGQVLPVSEIVRSIDAVTVADVTNVAKKVINGKPSMAAVGNLSTTPYLDQLL